MKAHAEIAELRQHPAPQPMLPHQQSHDTDPVLTNDTVMLEYEDD